MALQRITGKLGSRGVCAWEGTVPQSSMCQHLLWIDRLVPGDWKEFQAATHHLRITYRVGAHPRSITLFSQHYNFLIDFNQGQTRDPDWVALKVGSFMAEFIFPTCPEWWFLRQSTDPLMEGRLCPAREFFWDSAIKKRLDSIVRNTGLD